MTIRKEMLMHTEIDPNVRKMVTIILLVSTFIILMSQTMMITALPVIQHDVHRSLNTVQWLTTGYTLMIGVITPLSSNLYECFTNRQVFLGT
ncbi:MAG: MFS transporter, partial [Limosilactobacillus fermentum]